MPGERVLVTGSAGHLGEALVRVLRAEGREVVGLDLLGSPFTTVAGSVTARDVVRRCLDGVGVVLHAATLHKPHIGSHGRQAFVDTNVTGTLTLLEEAAAAGVGSFVFTSTTSVYGRALTPLPGEGAAWITEDVVPVPRNIYGVTKAAAEDLCEIISRDHGLPVVVLRVARFFPEADDRDQVRAAYPDANVKANEYLYRRVDLQDVVDAELLAMARAPAIGELLALAAALGVPRDAALDGLASGPLAGSVSRAQSTSSDFIVALAAKDLTLATDAAGLPQLTAARDWLRTAAAEGAAGSDVRHVVEHIRPLT